MSARRAPNHKTVVADKGADVGAVGQQMKTLVDEYFRTRDAALREKIILSNKPLAVKIARRYRGFVADMRDLVQEGYIGLMVALEKFDPVRGYAFSTYAAPWIRSHVQRAAWRELSVVETNVREKRAPELKEPCEEDEFSNRPHMQGVAKSLQSGHEAVRVTRDRRRACMLRGDIPLQRPIRNRHGEEGTRILMDYLREDPDCIERELERKEIAKIVRLSLALLSARERDIIDMSYMYDDPLTRAVIGKKHCISTARVGQLSRRAKNRMRSFLEDMGVTAP